MGCVCSLYLVLSIDKMQSIIMVTFVRKKKKKHIKAYKKKRKKLVFSVSVCYNRKMTVSTGFYKYTRIEIRYMKEEQTDEFTD